ncbi:hypothetical protein F544_5440 [Bibersteinia trehalosi USDA-ARS-USMARC-190]|uniref:Uncharacterized protein n=1 Tax=Bibersteinia trehalosi USDA-ARS-USMARC-190 TaxID=1263832 RepID=W0R4V7_BIBTR|nr:hypothetical protein F544_5440 [Bibersteinia trehalosi USDA-ARS-USMARC-190]
MLQDLNRAKVFIEVASQKPNKNQAKKDRKAMERKRKNACQK